MLLRFLNQDMAVYMTSITEIAPFRYGPRAAWLAWPVPVSAMASPALIVRRRYSGAFGPRPPAFCRTARTLVSA